MINDKTMYELAGEALRLSKLYENDKELFSQLLFLSTHAHNVSILLEMKNIQCGKLSRRSFPLAEKV